ncbi:DUF143-domain-containing protein [Neoconidiobolus thromboides FSU 785]|nr:DUF143-domain-containing protein [Neoconidiobolus thromboides FSU 785]
MRNILFNTCRRFNQNLLKVRVNRRYFTVNRLYFESYKKEIEVNDSIIKDEPQEDLLLKDLNSKQEIGNFKESDNTKDLEKGLNNEDKPVVSDKDKDLEPIDFNKVETDSDWFLKEEFESINEEIEIIENIDEQIIKIDEDKAASMKPSVLTTELFKEFLTYLGVKDIGIIDMRDKCSWTEYMIIAQGFSLRHLNSLSDRTRLFVKACQPFDKTVPELLSLEGSDKDDWVVLDAGRFVIHFMTEASREKYQLEKLWNNAIDPLSKLQALIENDPSLLDRQEYLEELASKLEEQLLEDDISSEIITKGNMDDMKDKP